ncbi:hypothetical protein F7725_024376 [Dissostichus mawsoni]|uniref:Isoaspartyl peptidase/L-asparaginase n=1 Tax=Dissostichus mawsoni TaxID=36200 RepID=A0A7J5XZ44_DISMA|nr:hypothetical protein F7725_024376 [Dissostichus mawsoni]
MPHRDQDGRKKERYELENQQEEADTIIVQQVLGCAGEAHPISVVSADTDVFVLLLHHYHQAGLDVPLIMESPRKERAIVDIKVTLSKHSEIVENLLPAHAISGCDTVASYYGLGKGSVINVLKAEYEPSAIGNMDAPFQQVLYQATAFISASLNPEEFGWKKDTCNRSLIPTHLPEDAKRVPDYILEMIRCGCKRDFLLFLYVFSCRGKMGTVGAVAVDSEGNIACATSTGGMLNKMEGRVGDTPCIGSGGYADNQVGAVSTTGHGEAIMKVTLARLILFHMEQGQSVEAASDLGVAYMKSRVSGLGGVVSVDPQGRWAARFSSLQMSWAAAQTETLHYGLYAGEHFTQSLGGPL